MIKIICVGKVKEAFLRDAINEYVKRLSKYTKVEIIEVMDVSLDNEELVLEKEKNSILKYINEKDYLIALDINGKEMTSLEFSSKIVKTLINYPNICFIIGGSYGISKEIKDKCFLLSFSRLTFPHQLFRVILLEQIYRSFKIINNEAYHKWIKFIKLSTIK